MVGRARQELERAGLEQPLGTVLADGGSAPTASCGVVSAPAIPSGG
jgi:hypothetical protein